MNVADGTLTFNKGRRLTFGGGDREGGMEGMLGLSVETGYVYYNWNNVHILGCTVLRLNRKNI